MNGVTALLGFAVTVLVTVAISGQFGGGEWYQSMHQPA